jgi:hypothetical protein
MEPTGLGSSAPDPAPAAMPVTVKRFDEPEQILPLERGRFEVISLGGATIGMGSYAPGWKWSRCAGNPPASEGAAGSVAVLLSGRARVRVWEGKEIELSPGDFFHAGITAEYDAWVIGNRPCEILYLTGVENLVRMLQRTRTVRA